MFLFRSALAAAAFVALASPPGAAAQNVGAGPDQPISLQGGQPPVFPPEAFATCAHGTTMVLVSIDESGQNRRSKVHKSSGNEALDEAALKAVRQWLFRPLIEGGVPKSGEALIPVVWEDQCPDQLAMTDPAARAIPPVGWDPKATPDGWDPYEVPASRTAHPPQYPKSAQCAGGTTKVRVNVAANGNVRNVGVAESSGNPALDAAAVAAARQWTYRPGRRGELVVGGEIVLPVAFPSCGK
jgi:TonB family protein